MILHKKAGQVCALLVESCGSEYAFISVAGKVRGTNWYLQFWKNSVFLSEVFPIFLILGFILMERNHMLLKLYKNRRRFLIICLQECRILSFGLRIRIPFFLENARSLFLICVKWRRPPNLPHNCTNYRYLITHRICHLNVFFAYRTYCFGVPGRIFDLK